MFFLLVISAQALSFSKSTPGEYYINLTAGVYNVTCFGAQGGQSSGFSPIKSGGKGTLTTGIISVTGDGLSFWGYIGGKGSYGSTGPNAGGYNGGGKGGMDTGLVGFNNDAPGGGGGATELRFNDNNFDSRVIVAAGGSGAAYACEGAPGGDINGYHADRNNHFVASSGVVDQIKGYTNGVGGNGINSDSIPGSGGGGGWRGGSGASGTFGEANSYLAVGHSGSSYISGHSGCSKNNRFSFNETKMIKGHRIG